MSDAKLPLRSGLCDMNIIVYDKINTIASNIQSMQFAGGGGWDVHHPSCSNVHLISDSLSGITHNLYFKENLF